MEIIPVTEQVIERLLIVKGLLAGIRTSAPQPDRIALAQNILTSHDAAELAIAAIGQHLNKMPKESQSYLMNYFPLIAETHPGRSVKGKAFFPQLNDVRIGIKHKGLFPHPSDWKRVGPLTWDYISDWCNEYLGLALEDLDQSALIADLKVKEDYAASCEACRNREFKKLLEHLGVACNALFWSNRALNSLSVGVARTEDAIKLTAFGVRANEYLALQQFLPKVLKFPSVQKPPVIIWDQKKYGHPANWTETNVRFCLRAFVELALRIQNADSIPGPSEFLMIYGYKISALFDDVEVFREERGGMVEPIRRVLVRTLRAGESLDAMNVESEGGVAGVTSFYFEKDSVFKVDSDKVRISCIPNGIFSRFVLNLIEIDYEPPSTATFLTPFEPRK